MKYKNKINGQIIEGTQLMEKKAEKIEREFQSCKYNNNIWSIIDNDVIYMAKNGDYIIKDKYGNISFCPKFVFEWTYIKEE